MPNRNPINRDRFISTVLMAGLGLASAGMAFAQSPASQPTTAPASQPTDKEKQKQLLRELQASLVAFNTLGLKETSLGDPARRAELRPSAVPILNQLLATSDAFLKSYPNAAGLLKGLQLDALAYLAALEDPAGVARLQNMTENPDLRIANTGKGIQFLGRWMVAGPDAAAQKAIVDDLEVLDRAQPGSEELTEFTQLLSQRTKVPEISKRLDDLVLTVMKSPLADQARDLIAAEIKLKGRVNQPLVIEGKTIDGQSFTTANWKGKVVLVDFWATWCVPCVAGMPELKKTYEEYHEKGLEIVGVSSDVEPENLTDFISSQAILWPQLFDRVAAERKINPPLPFDLGVRKLPTMLLIDRKGVLRTIQARTEMKELIPKLLAE